MTPSLQYLYCVGTKPLGSHHRFKTRNSESKFMKISVKFWMCLQEFFLKERERKNKHNFGGFRAYKKFPTCEPIQLRARISLHNNFPSANETIIVSISTSKNIAQTIVPNTNLFFFFFSHQTVLMSRNIRGYLVILF